jgi:carboxymethylenebutenolidase
LRLPIGVCKRIGAAAGSPDRLGKKAGMRRTEMGSMIDFARPDGGKSKGYLATAGQGRPGIVVIQEWWGLNDQICGVADRFARAGYNALAPDLYKGRLTARVDEASHLMSSLDFADATNQDLRGAAQHLQGMSGKVAVMGFCMGGALTIAAAVHVPGLAAAVPFYGIPPKDFADPAQIRIPLQGHFANQDDWCTPLAVDEFEAALTTSGTPFEVHRYEAAHAFANERSAAYNVDSAIEAWDRMLGFLQRTL